jgi:hypothetical protein
MAATAIFLLISMLIQSQINFGKTLASPEEADLKVDFCEDCQILIGGLFPVHAPHSSLLKTDENKFFFNSSDDDELSFKSKCGEIKKERGIQRMEAMLYAVDLINKDSNLLKNMKLGVKIYDTCDRDTIALDKSVNFLSDHFLLNTKDIATDFVCDEDDEYTYYPTRNDQAIYKRRIVGVIGAASSSVSVQVASLLRLFQVILVKSV